MTAIPGGIFIGVPGGMPLDQSPLQKYKNMDDKEFVEVLDQFEDNKYKVEDFGDLVVESINKREGPTSRIGKLYELIVVDEDAFQKLIKYLRSKKTAVEIDKFLEGLKQFVKLNSYTKIDFDTLKFEELAKMGPEDIGKAVRKFRKVKEPIQVILRLFQQASDNLSCLSALVVSLDKSQLSKLVAALMPETSDEAQRAKAFEFIKKIREDLAKGAPLVEKKEDKLVNFYRTEIIKFCGLSKEWQNCEKKIREFYTGINSDSKLLFLEACFGLDKGENLKSLALNLLLGMKDAKPFINQIKDNKIVFGKVNDAIKGRFTELQSAQILGEDVDLAPFEELLKALQ